MPHAGGGCCCYRSCSDDAVGGPPLERAAPWRRVGRRLRYDVPHLFALFAMFLCLAVRVTITETISLRVAVVSNSPDSNLSQFVLLGLKGCFEASQINSQIECQGYQYLDSSVKQNVLEENWKSLVKSMPNANVFISVDYASAPIFANIAAVFPNIYFIQIDSFLDSPPKNAIGIGFAEDQSGYLAGVVAGIFTKNLRVGIIAGPPIPPILRYRNGFLRGTLSVCSSCEVHSIISPSYTDIVMGINAANDMIANRVDVIFGAGGRMGSNGILHAAEANGTMVIGVDADESQGIFANGFALKYLLTSAIKLVNVAVNRTLNDISFTGTGGINRVLGSSVGGIGLAKFTDSKNYSLELEIPVTIQTSSNVCPSTFLYTRSAIINLVKSNLELGITSSGVDYQTGNLLSLMPSYQNTWNSQKAFGVSRYAASSIQGHSFLVTENDKMVLWGGQSIGLNISSDVMIFDFTIFTWTALNLGSSVTPQGRKFHAAGYYSSENYMVIFGGQNGDKEILGDTWVFKMNNPQWTKISNSNPGESPSARTQMAYSTVGSKLYMYGGISISGSPLSEFWEFDMKAFKWRILTGSDSDRPGLLYDASMIAANKTILILFGGIKEQIKQNTLFTVDVEKIRNGVSIPWQHEIPEGTPPEPVSRAAITQVDGSRILITGGSGSLKVSNQSVVWRTDRGSWGPSIIPELPTTLNSHQMVTLSHADMNDICVYQPMPTLSTCAFSRSPILISVGGISAETTTGIVVLFAGTEPLAKPSGQIPVSALIFITLLGLIGIIISFILMVFIWYYREKPIIKANNPRFSLIILVGSIFVYFAMIWTSWIRPSKSSVVVFITMLSLGFTLIFSALIVKTYQIYSIFTSVMRTKYKLWKYFAAIAFILTVESIVLIVWFIFDPIPVRTVVISDVEWNIRTVDSRGLASCCAPIALLTLIGIWLSFKTRHVQSQFNESQYIAMAVYLFAVASFIAFPIYLLLDSPVVVYIICSTVVILTTFSVIGIFFGHKIIALWVPEKSDIVVSQGINAENEDKENGDAGQGPPVLRCRHCRQVITGPPQSMRTRLGTAAGTGNAATSGAYVRGGNYSGTTSNAAGVGKGGAAGSAASGGKRNASPAVKKTAKADENNDLMSDEEKEAVVNQKAATTTGDGLGGGGVKTTAALQNSPGSSPATPETADAKVARSKGQAPEAGSRANLASESIGKIAEEQ